MIERVARNEAGLSVFWQLTIRSWKVEVAKPLITDWKILLKHSVQCSRYGMGWQ